MTHICIEKKIRKLRLPNGYNVNDVQIGIPVLNDEALKIGLKNIGDIVLPSSEFGCACNRNAYGYYYPDKSKEKEKRYICTNWVQPFGNSNASYVACDIYRSCYPQIYVEPTEVELMLYSNEEGKKFVIAYLENNKTEDYVLKAIQIFVEIYKKCFVFKDGIKIDETTNRRRCNWEILPPGKKPGEYLKEQFNVANKPTESYDIKRLQVLDEYTVEEIVEGINGFQGYYAYIFSKHCVLESAIYGNATYILLKENWETMSQKTKGELLNEKVVIAKIVHRENWVKTIKELMIDLEKQ